ncbi:hypothetical protein [Chlorogloea sp. CCALA 695]|uniref:hypothetical protein n=1 Tax=Chlorogloea sp. CCALA 695 TaxID=2107693 RepID=UPI000D062E5C|nr:hypothetical protein [Chlorogloea sp. CCALA 695]PSB33890.1 hypothetical protein C7B70_05705 [Chlorogloea sp. CCALA 695]
MAEQAIDDNNESGFLIILLPIAILIIFLFATWPIILFLLLLSVGLNIWQRYQWEKWSKQVDPLFYNLIQLNQGAITPLDLAMKANFSAVTAKRYLDTKAQEFGAQCRNYERQDAVYYFITASIIGNILDESEPLPQLVEVEETANIAPVTPVVSALSPKEVEEYSPVESPLGLIQSELAKRLDVHSSTIYKRRDDPDFSTWTQTRDPEGVSWIYSSDTRLFSPLSAE